MSQAPARLPHRDNTPTRNALIGASSIDTTRSGSAAGKNNPQIRFEKVRKSRGRRRAQCRRTFL
jgi:hypothetical protein